MNRMRAWVRVLVPMLLISGTGWRALGAVVAFDSAQDPAYTGAWSDGANGGSGFGPWVLVSSNSAGFFCGTSAANGDGDPGLTGDIDTAGRAWGLYANLTPSMGTALATRPFSSALESGQRFAIDFDNGYVQSSSSPSGTVGFALLNSAGEEKVRFQFVGGESSFQVVDNSGVHDIGLPFTSQGLHIVFTMGEIAASSTYRLEVSTVGHDGLTNTTLRFDGLLCTNAAGSAQVVDRVQVFSLSGGDGSTADLFCNSISIPPSARAAFRTEAFDDTADAAYGAGWTAGTNGGAGWGGGWTFTPGATGFSGAFTGSSQNNGFGDGNIDTSGLSWGLWANGGGSINAIRPFGFTLEPGQSFACDMDPGYIENGGAVGFTLTGYGDPRSSSQVTVEFRGGESDFVISAGKTYWSMETNSGVAYTTRGLHVVVEMGTGGVFTCAMTPRGGLTRVIRFVDPAGGGGLDHVELFNSNAGSGSDHDAFFNNLEVFRTLASEAHDNADEANYAGGWDRRTDGDGFDGAWQVDVSGPPGAWGGSFVGPAAQIDNGGRAWGLYTGGDGAMTKASRALPHALQVGESVVVDMQNKAVSNSALVAVQLAGTSQWQFGLSGGEANYHISVFTYPAPVVYDTGVPFTTNGIRLVYTQDVDTNGEYQFRAAITPKGGGTQVISGPLRGLLGGTATLPALDRVELLTDNPSGSAYDVFFNNLAVIGAPRLSGISLASGTNVVLSVAPSGVLLEDVLACDDLVSGLWTPIASNLTGSGEADLFVEDPVPLPASQRFYRIRYH